MAFFDRFKKVYVVKATCFNCGHTQDLRVPKGMVIDSYLRTEAATCENCGNPTLRRIMTSQVAAPQSARAPFKQRYPPKELPPLPPSRPIRQPVRPPMRRPPVQPLTEQQRKRLQQSRRPRPPYRPQVEEYPEDFQQEVEYPVNEPVDNQQQAPEPDWNTKPKKINFWTGKEEAL